MKNYLLKQYILKSSLIDINSNLKVRIPKELETEWMEGLYTDKLLEFKNIIDEIKLIDIGIPKKDLVFNIYIVPGTYENVVNLLNIPAYFGTNCGGQPIKNYDSNVFPLSLGLTNNIMNHDYTTLSMRINKIHELSHIIYSYYFKAINLYSDLVPESLISEGFAEAFPLYVMGYQEKFDDYNNILKCLNSDDIYSAGELIEFSKNKDFFKGKFKEKDTVSFESTYISSYLFVLGCCEKIRTIYDINKSEALLKLVDLVVKHKGNEENALKELSQIINLDYNELINSKQLQISGIKKQFKKI